jgi:hypothetical protein
MIPVSLATGWVKSVAYVSALSLWALGHWSAWQAARVEVYQQQEDIQATSSRRPTSIEHEQKLRFATLRVRMHPDRR